MKKRKKKLKVIVVMPAYNAEKTLEKTYQAIPKNIVDNILVVDDASKDRTLKIVKKIGLEFEKHPINLGYGANQKTCYKKALDMGGDIIVMLHPDYQYPPKYIKYLIKPIMDNSFDIMLGSRIRTRKETLKNGMPLYKYVGNRLLTLIENIVLGLNLTEYHTGFRAFKKEVFKTIPFANFSNDFIFDQQILITAHVYNFRIGEIYTPCLYRRDSSSINFMRSVKYGCDIIFNLFTFVFRRGQFTQKRLH